MSETAKEGRPYWERHAKNYDRSMALLGGPIPKMVDLAAQGVRGAGTVLEVAAGTGLVTVALARSAGEVVATDYAEAMVVRLRERLRDSGLTNVRCEQADIYALPYPQASFDAIVAANVLHLVPDLAAALAALKAVLKPGGCLIAPTYCHNETTISRLVSRVLAAKKFPSSRRFTATGLREALEAAGLRVSLAQTLHGVIPIGYAQGRFEH